MRVSGIEWDEHNRAHLREHKRCSEQDVEDVLDSLYYRIAEATGRDAEAVREDARRGRTFTAAEAIGYGLVQDRVAKRPG